MSDTTKRKKPNMIHIGIGILTVLLVVFIVILMQLVSNIQGTARVVNYAGLIRGETQRIIKLENSGQREDELIKEVQSFIEGLRHGNDKLKLVRLKDDDFQDKMKELDEYFISLHKEIYRVRTVGYEHTDIISKSERFFKICDEATGLAEVYAQRKATSLATLEKFITADIVVLMLLIGYEFIKAVRFAAMNRILRHKAYLDNATGLPNKNKCEEILGELNPPEDITVCSFDLNNLRRINDSMGHDAGDTYIYRFAVCLRSSIPSEYFVGRLGGDEFIAVLQGLDKQAVRKLFEDLRKDIAAESKEHREIPLSYAAGFAMASDYPGKTMRELFNDADKNMYINKNHVKREEALEEKRLNYQLLKLLNQHGKNFLDCLYLVKEEAHIRIEFFMARFPKGIRKAIVVFNNVVLLVINVCMVYFGYQLVRLTAISKLPVTKLPTSAIFYLIPVSAAVSCLALIGKLFGLYKVKAEKNFVEGIYEEESLTEEENK